VVFSTLALRVKIRDEGRGAQTRRLYLGYGSLPQTARATCGDCGSSQTEGASSAAGGQRLKNRGVDDILIAVSTGPEGAPARPHPSPVSAHDAFADLASFHRDQQQLDLRAGRSAQIGRRRPQGRSTRRTTAEAAAQCMAPRLRSRFPGAPNYPDLSVRAGGTCLGTSDPVLCLCPHPRFFAA